LNVKNTKERPDFLRIFVFFAILNRRIFPTVFYLFTMAKDWKERLGVVYSTNPDFNYETSGEEGAATRLPAEQCLRVTLDRKQRKGKTVTLVEGFIGTAEDLKILGKLLKTRCGVGGSEKDGMIIIQGEFVSKIKDILIKEGYRVK
jgi:translation initiation factor 1